MVSRAVFFLWLYYLVALAGFGLGTLLCTGQVCSRYPWASEALLSIFLLTLALVLLARLHKEAPELFRRPRPLELLGLPLWSVPVSWGFAVAGFALLPGAEGNVDIPSGLKPVELFPFWIALAVVVPLVECAVFA